MATRRRVVWLGALLALSALALSLFVVTHSGTTVAVYNNTSHPFRRITVTVGTERHDTEGLECKESIAFAFKTTSHSQDVRLVVESEAPLVWHAPSLASSKVLSITLRVDDFGGVTLSVENSWSFALSRLLN